MIWHQTLFNVRFRAQGAVMAQCPNVKLEETIPQVAFDTTVSSDGVKPASAVLASMVPAITDEHRCTVVEMDCLQLVEQLIAHHGGTVAVLEAAKGSGRFEAVAAAAEAGAEATKKMRAKAGRSSYLSNDVTNGHADPGAVAMALALRAMCRL